MSLAKHLSRRLEGHPFGLFLLGKAFNETSLSLEAFIADYEAHLLTAKTSLWASITASAHSMPISSTACSIFRLNLRSLFSKLWLFHAPFLPESAIAIFDPEHETRGEEHLPIADQLHALWQCGLLTHEEMNLREGTLRFYRLPPVLRPYVEQYLAGGNGRKSLVERFGLAYAKLASNIYDKLDRGGIGTALALQCYEDLTDGVLCVKEMAQGYYLLHWGWVLYWLGDRIQGLKLTERALEIGRGMISNWSGKPETTWQGCTTR